MKENETEYLNKLFTTSSDIGDEVEIDVPLVDVPMGLNKKLHSIAEPTLVATKPTTGRFFESWPKLTSIAATLFVAVMGFQFYQQQQTLNQLEQAQADLATALHYLSEANRITREQVRSSLNENMKGAKISPALEIERENDSLNDEIFEPKTESHTL